MRNVVSGIRLSIQGYLLYVNVLLGGIFSLKGKSLAVSKCNVALEKDGLAST